MTKRKEKMRPYEGDEPYIYFAFAEDDKAAARKILRPLMERGCRVWYCVGPAGSAAEVLRRQTRAGGAALTVVYLSDAACADKDTKSSVLVNQKFGRPLFCLNPDGRDRHLAMGLREDTPYMRMAPHARKSDIIDGILHAEGFSQDVLGEPVTIRGGFTAGKLATCICALAAFLLAVCFTGVRYLGWFAPEVPEIVDEVTFTDPVLGSAVREALGGGAITEEGTARITFLRLDGLPEDWEELEKLPALERIRVPQQTIQDGITLPDGCTVELSGGDAP